MAKPQGYRTNCEQVRRAQRYCGQRRNEKKSEHTKIVPKSRQVHGKNSMWARHYHDASQPMDTFIPKAVTPPRG